MGEPKGEKLMYEDDQVGSFFRVNIDRSTYPMSGEFLDEEGTPLLGAAINTLRNNKSLAMLDAGCGTGHTVWEVRDQALFRTGNYPNPDIVKAIGVNDTDFSQESSKKEVREAISDESIRYIVNDIETVDIPLASQDLIWSFEVMLHNPNPKVARIIRHLLPMLKPNGRFYFNITPEQRNDPEISSAIDDAKENGMFAFEYEKEKSDDKRTFVMLRNEVKSDTTTKK